jgi:glucose 1-dehydrogenase
MSADGIVTIVTGAASGIGRATASRLASDGAIVVAADINRDGVQETGAMLGREVDVQTVDVSRPDEADRLVAHTVERFGHLDTMIANAGVVVERPFVETTPEDLDYVLGVNLKGVFFCGQAAARSMIAQGRHGQIVNVASVYAEVCNAGFSAYCASKGGVRMLTKVMAVELGPLGIRVNAVGPGPVRTGMNPLDDPEEVAEFEREIPLGRIGGPEDIASAIALLVSDDAGWITGTTLFVDGGWIVRR